MWRGIIAQHKRLASYSWDRGTGEPDKVALRSASASRNGCSTPRAPNTTRPGSTRTRSASGILSARRPSPATPKPRAASAAATWSPSRPRPSRRCGPIPRRRPHGRNGAADAGRLMEADDPPGHAVVAALHESRRLLTGRSASRHGAAARTADRAKNETVRSARPSERQNAGRSTEAVAPKSGPREPYKKKSLPATV